MNDRSIERVINTCVDRYASGDWTLEECLRRYPEHAGIIRDYLELAESVADVSPQPPSKAAMAFGERLVLGELDRIFDTRQSRPSLRGVSARLVSLLAKSRLATATALVAFAMLVGSGVTLAATVSGPTSPLYGYKLALDQVRVGFTAEEDKADVYIDLAERRLREMEQLAVSDRSDGIDSISANYKAMLDEGIVSLQSLSKRDAIAVRQRFAKTRQNFRNRLETHRHRLELMAGPSRPELRQIADSTIRSAEANLLKLPTAPPATLLAEATVRPEATPATQQIPATATPSDEQPTPAQALAQAEIQATTDAATEAVGDAEIPDEVNSEAQVVEGTAETSPAPAAEPASVLQTPPPEPSTVEIEGVVTAMAQSALVVDGRTIVLDENIVPSPIIRGMPAVGVSVRLRGIVLPDGTVVLVELQTLTPEAADTPSPTPSTAPTAEPAPTPLPGDLPAPTPSPAAEEETPKLDFEITGTVSDIVGSIIVVDGRTIDTEAWTEGDVVILGSIEIESIVLIRGYVLPGNVLAATEIIVLDGSGEEADGDDVSTPTPESSQTPVPETNEVVISGVVVSVSEDAVEVDGQIILIRRDGEGATEMGVEPLAGDDVTIIARRQEDGALIALVVSVESAEVTPTPTPTVADAVKTPTNETEQDDGPPEPDAEVSDQNGA